MKQVVLDTGVIISALLRKDGVSRRAFLIAVDNCKPLVSLPTLSELQEVLSRPNFTTAFTKEEAMEALEILAQRCETIVVESVLAACRDKKDDMHIRYDNEANTMYVNFGVPVPADDSELGKNDILYRYKEGEVIGVTVTQALLSLPTNLTPPPHFRMS